MVKTIEWDGHSGRNYKYWIFEIDYVFKPNQPGNYVFAKQTEAHKWRPIYIGQASDLGEGFDGHQKIQCIRDNGATHIHAHKNKKQENRLAEAVDLIDHWHPACSD
jgi:hypothetical protein